jgi:hypothetical protein
MLALRIINKIINKTILAIIAMEIGITMGVSIALEKMGKGITFINIEALYRLGMWEYISMAFYMSASKNANIESELPSDRTYVWLVTEWYEHIKKIIWMIYLLMEHYVFINVMRFMAYIAEIISYISGMEENKVMLQYGNWIFILAVINILLLLLVMLMINNIKMWIEIYKKYKNYRYEWIIKNWIRERREEIEICIIIIMIYVIIVNSI